MSRFAKIAMGFVGVAGVIVAGLAYRTPTSGDGQDALVIPFVIFWTGLALVFVWMFDGIIRALRHRFSKSSQ